MHLSRLPAAEEMRDLDGLAHIRFSCAQIRLARGDHERGGLQSIHDELDEAFRIVLRLERPDAIGHSGVLLGQVLAMGGQPERAFEVLGLARNAFLKLGNREGASHCEAVIAAIKGTQP
jgi:hypothetical protein